MLTVGWIVGSGQVTRRSAGEADRPASRDARRNGEYKSRTEIEKSHKVRVLESLVRRA